MLEAHPVHCCLIYFYFYIFFLLPFFCTIKIDIRQIKTDESWLLIYQRFKQKDQRCRTHRHNNGEKKLKLIGILMIKKIPMSISI